MRDTFVAGLGHEPEMTAEAQQASDAEPITMGGILQSIGQWIGGQFGAAVRQTAPAIQRLWTRKRRHSDQDRLAEHERWLVDIRSLADQLKDVTRDQIVQHTMHAVSNSLGFGQVTLSEIGGASPFGQEFAPGKDQAPGQEWANDAYRLGLCTFVPAPGTKPALSSPHNPVPWHNGDRLYVSLIGNTGLLAVLDIDRPHNGLRPTEAALQVMEIMANQATTGLCADHDQVQDEQIAELSTLLEIERQINAKPDFGYVMDTTLDWAIQITSAIAGTLALRCDRTDVMNTESRVAAAQGTPDRDRPAQGTPTWASSGQESAQGRQMLRVVAHQGYSPEMDKYWNIPWPIDEGIIGQAMQTGQTAIAQDVTQDGDYVHAATGPRAHLAMPIVHDERVIGVIGLESARPDGFAEGDVSLLEHLSTHAALAIENVQLYERLNRRVGELSSLQEMSLDLFSNLLPSLVLERTAAHTQSITQADRVDIYVYDEQKDTLSYGTGRLHEGTCDHPPVPMQQNPLAWTVARQGQAQVIHDARQHPLLADIGGSIGSMASIPIFSKSDRVLGVLDVSFQETHTFAPDELGILSLLCEQAAIAIENAQLYADLQHANDTKNKLASAISHALKVPTTSIQGYARLMTLETGGPVTEQQRAFLDTILRNARQVDALVSDLLHLSRIEAGRIQTAPEPIDLSNSVGQAISAVRRELGAQCEPKVCKPSITVDLAQDLPNVHADASWLTRVWTHLMRNALRYTPDDGQIVIRAWRHARSQEDPNAERWVTCAIESSDTGFPVEEQERIFEPFYLAQLLQETREPGTGLELAIARGVVELYGGQIWIESEPGKGSTIFFTLPQAK